MNFKKLSPEWNDRLSALWEKTFGDSREYIDLFLENCLPNAEAFGAVEDEKLIAMLFLLPMKVRSGEKSFPASYIYAVATEPEFQNMGISTMLLSEVHEYLRKKKTALSVLVPASEELFHFYSARGFETNFHLDRFIFERSTHDTDVVLSETSLLLEKSTRDAFFSRAELYCEYDESQLSYREKEVLFLGGKILSFSLDKKHGYAVCFPDADRVYVKEFCFEYSEKVLDAIADFFASEKLEVRMMGKTCPFAQSFIYQNDPLLKSSSGYISLVLD